MIPILTVVQLLSHVSLWHHGLQHTKISCPSPSPRAWWNSWPSSQWWPSNHFILCHPLLFLPSIFPSIRVFSNEIAIRIRKSKYWSFSFSISPSNEYSGLISFRIHWFDLLALWGIPKSLKHHSSKASILGIQPSLWSNSHIHTWLLEKPKLWLDGSLLAKKCVCFLMCFLDWS